MALPYRGDERALRQRLEGVEAQLLENDRSAERGQPAPSGGREGLEAERAASRERLEAERAELFERLAVFGDRFSPNDLRRASPCGADWGAMAGDERVRFCSKCQKNVYNLSGLRHAEAEAIVQNAEGELYERLRQRADGTVLSGDCPEGSAERFQRRLPLIAGTGALVAASAVASLSFALAESAPLKNPEPAFAFGQGEHLDPRVFAKYYGPFEFPPERGAPLERRSPKVVGVGPLPPKHVAKPGSSVPRPVAQPGPSALRPRGRLFVQAGPQSKNLERREHGAERSAREGCSSRAWRRVASPSRAVGRFGPPVGLPAQASRSARSCSRRSGRRALLLEALGPTRALARGARADARSSPPARSDPAAGPRAGGTRC